MAEHQAMEGQFTSVTFFGTCSPKFSPIPADGQLQTDLFLAATKQILPFVDKLGTAFSLVKKDMQGNVQKIEKHVAKDPETYKTINAMVEEDQSGAKKGVSEGCVGVLWLKRALEFMHSVFMELLSDNKNGVTDDNLSPVVYRAYEKTLKQYHGWMTQKVIGGVIKLVPYRSNFFKTLMRDSSATVEMVLKDLELYQVNLGSTIQLLNDLLINAGKDSQEKV